MALKKRGLGRNLEALLGDVSSLKSTSTEKKDTPSSESDSRIEGELQKLPINHIAPGKYQPRQDFPEEALQELANSIRAQGVIQPILVRTIKNNQYEIVAGERRWRAAKLAGLTEIPSLVRELPDEAAIAMALIENIQREDLNPVEEAKALERLIEEFSMTHEQIANAVGKSRTAVSNQLRLLSLAGPALKQLREGLLEMGHARALLSLTPERQVEVANIIIAKGLSVRATEELVRHGKHAQSKPQAKKEQDPVLHEMQETLTKHLGTDVLLQQNAKGRGRMVIKYKNASQLQQLLQHITAG